MPFIPSLILLCVMVLATSACQPSLRVMQAAVEAVQDEMAEPVAWQQSPQPQGERPAIEPSITRPAAALELSGWPDPVTTGGTEMAPKAPAQLTHMATGEVHKPASAAMAKPHQWTYAGPYGPDHWGTLSPSFAACAAGLKQSPIDLASARAGTLPGLKLNYRKVPLVLANNGHTISLDQPPGSWLSIDGARYDLVNVHLHAPGEHALGGQFAAMEIHFVHQNLHGQLAVLAVMVQPGPGNSQLASIAKYAPAKPMGENHGPDSLEPAGVEFDPIKLMPKDGRYIRYLGSLTTPPCSEGVAWHVLVQPVSASNADIEKLSSLMPQPNSRPLQRLNKRPVFIN